AVLDILPFTPGRSPKGHDSPLWTEVGEKVGLLYDAHALRLKLANDLSQEDVVLETLGPAQDAPGAAVEAPAVEQYIFAHFADQPQVPNPLTLQRLDDLVPLAGAKVVKLPDKRLQLRIGRFAEGDGDNVQSPGPHGTRHDSW